MNIEKQIGLKAIAIYIFIGLIVALAWIYGNRLKQQIQLQKTNIAEQQEILSLSNTLVAEVSQLLMQTTPYLSTQNPHLISYFDNEIIKLDSLIVLLISKDAENTEALEQLNLLLRKQADNIRELHKNLVQENPLAHFQNIQEQQKLLEASPIEAKPLDRDTIIKLSERQSFFRRMRNAFNPKIDTTYIIYNAQIDSLHIARTDSLSLLTEVDLIVQKAEKQYQQNIADIRQYISQFIQDDRKITTEINGLLTQIYNRTLAAIQGTVKQSEQIINRNFLMLTMGGIAILILILVLLLMIIFDVNKGKQAREKLKQVMDTRHQLLLAVAHDIKTPLNSITAYAAMGNQDQSNQDQSNQSPIANASGHIHALLENLIQFSSIEQGRVSISKSIIDTAHLAQELQAWFAPIAAQKQLDLTFEYPAVLLKTDALKLKQIATNIIANAIKYTLKGSVSVVFTFENEMLSLTVADTGVGIPSDKIPTVFMPFSRIAENNAISEGSGVGMYVVKNLVDLLGGEIHIASQVGAGTQVNVHLPVEQIITEIHRGTKKIKVFEDDQSMKIIVEGMLEQLGHQVVEENCDLLITDLEMSHYSGLQVLKDFPDKPIILMTGRSDFTEEKALELGFAGFIHKPFSLIDLKFIIGEGEQQAQDEDSFLSVIDDEILQVFRESTIENQANLKQLLKLRNFKKAQAICHKMLPMFAQLGYPTDALKRMDASGGKLYQGWMQDVQSIIDIKV